MQEVSDVRQYMITWREVFGMDMKMGLSTLKSFYIMHILLERTDDEYTCQDYTLNPM